MTTLAKSTRRLRTCLSQLSSHCSRTFFTEAEIRICPKCKLMVENAEYEIPLPPRKLDSELTEFWKGLK